MYLIYIIITYNLRISFRFFFFFSSFMYEGKKGNKDKYIFYLCIYRGKRREKGSEKGGNAWAILEASAQLWAAGLGSLVAQHHAQSGGQHFLVTSRVGRSNGAALLNSPSSTASITMVAADVASRADLAAIRSCSAWQSYVVGGIVHAGEFFLVSLVPRDTSAPVG